MDRVVKMVRGGIGRLKGYELVIVLCAPVRTLYSTVCGRGK